MSLPDKLTEKGIERILKDEKNIVLQLLAVT
jgi:hypothetical protein